MTTSSKPAKKEKLWTGNFFLLWQGQFVSLLGDAFYEIALGFWVLAVTGSTALMGTLMAASNLPRVLIYPFSGVAVDRSNRKALMVAMDLIRGSSIVFVGVAAFLGFLKIWMVFAAGITLSSCAAFFGPAVSSSIPDIVPKSKLSNANSVFGMIQAGSSIAGSTTGGYIFSVFGAPFMFLFDGLSYLASGVFNFFLKIPKTIRIHDDKHFWADMKEGYVFVWKFRGLRYVLALISILNFFSFIAIVLFLPLYQKTPSLGALKYGISMASLTGGMLLGMVFNSLVKIPPSKRLIIFMISTSISSLCFASIALIYKFPVILVLLFTGGFFYSIVNVFINTVIQLTVPQNMRGKVFSLVQMVTSGLTPFSMALGGILGEFIPIRVIILSCFLIIFFSFLPLVFLASFRRFINFNPKTQVLEDIL